MASPPSSGPGSPEGGESNPAIETIGVDPAKDTSPLLVGELIDGKYKLIAKIGRGGMGVVYQAEHALMNRSVALKLLHPHLVESEEFLKRFRHEAQVASKLRHPNAVMIYDYGMYKNAPYLVMEFVQGKTLKDLIAEKGPQPVELVCKIVEQIASALNEAHALGIVHRDLKPDNILLSERAGNPYFVQLLDFGIAKILQPSGDTQTLATQAGIFFGTPRYASPEQVLGKELDGRSDLYSLGVIIYEALSGVVPFDAPSVMELLLKHLHQEPVPLRQAKPHLKIPEKVDAIVLKCLSKDRENRFQTVQAISDALHPFVTGGDGWKNSGASGIRSGSLKPLLVLGGILLLLGIGAGGVLMLQRGKDHPQLTNDVKLANVEPTPFPSKIPTLEEQLLRNDAKETIVNTIPTVAPTVAAILTQAAVPTDSGINTLLPEVPTPLPSSVPTPGATNDDQKGLIVKLEPVDDSKVEIKPTSAPTETVAKGTSLEIETTPPGANILIDGVPRGTTPHILTDLSAGTHQLKLRLSKYADYTTAVNLLPGMPIAINETLVESDSIVPDSKDNSRDIYRAADALYRSKKYQAAIPQFEKVIQLDPAFVKARLSLGICYMRTGRSSEALQQFQAALKQNPDYPPTHFNLACYYATVGKVDQALDALEQTIELEPAARRWAKSEPDLKSLRGNPDFQKLLE